MGGRTELKRRIALILFRRSWSMPMNARQSETIFDTLTRQYGRMPFEETAEEILDAINDKPSTPKEDISWKAI